MTSVYVTVVWKPLSNVGTDVYGHFSIQFGHPEDGGSTFLQNKRTKHTTWCKTPKYNYHSSYKKFDDSHKGITQQIHLKAKPTHSALVLGSE
jgi:hypothetical protein